MHPREASWGGHLGSVRHTPEPKRGRARLAHTKMHLKSEHRLKVQERRGCETFYEMEDKSRRILAPIVKEEL